MTAYRKSTLPNGIRLVTEELPYSHAVSLGLWLEVGSRDEAAHEGGLSHFLEHMAFKGTPRRTAYDIAREIDQLGGAGNAFTTRETTCFHIKVLEGQLPRAVDLMVDLAMHPLCRSEDVERERTVILEEIAAQEDNPEDLVQVEFAREFWRGCALGRPILGEATDVARYSREDLLSYRRAAYRPELTVVAAAGNLDHDRLLDLVGPALEAFKNGNPARERETYVTHPGYYLFQRDLEQAHLCLGTKALPAGDARRFTASLLNVILGGNMSSRLFQVIREELGLAYNIYSYLSFFKDTGLLEICAGVNPKNLAALIEAVNGELRRLKAERVAGAELAAAKEYVKSSIILNAEDSEQRMLRLAKNEINFGHYIPYEDIIAGVERVNQDEILELAEELFRVDQWGMAVLGPVAADLPLGKF
jgi:predicted Zn-dependent peptidase|uniref:Insulinase family protein n=1 Tax=Desulfobacca acetoxidans TaxID=60893 RepID=A0A7C3UVW4_9BACT